MNPSLKPYPRMKDSGVEWLGLVPEHWEVSKLKRSVSNVVNVTSSRTKDELYLALENVESWTGRIQVPKCHVEFDSQVKRFVSGDILFGKLRPYLAKVARPLSRGVCVSEFLVLRPFNNDLSGCFLEPLLRSKNMIDIVNASTFGAKMPRADWSFIGNLKTPIPPLSEQIAIVKYLNHVDRKVKRFIRAKRKLIALLEEQKQVIIHQAVTRGLDPNVPMKDSGVEWLGEVPEHWEVKRVKEITTPIEQGWSPQCDAQPAGNQDWGVLKVGCVNSEKFDISQNKRLPGSLLPKPDLQICDGDILVSRANTRELLGLAALVVNPRPQIMICDKLFRFRVHENLTKARFLVMALRSRPSRDQIETQTNGASDSMQNIGQNVIRNMVVALPPLVEQEKISCFTLSMMTAIDGTISTNQREIELLNEYRTRLISDVVTGKLDVREAAAELPDEEEPDIVEENTDIEELEDDVIPDLNGGMLQEYEEAE